MERKSDMKKFAVMIFILIWTLMFCLAGCKPKAAPEPTREAGLANPWVETDWEGLIRKTGLDLNVPEGAENTAFRVNESEKMGEMSFTLNGLKMNARVKAASEFEDISGMHYTWDHVDDTARRWHQEKLMRGKDGENTVDVFLWFDVVPGVMYSLSCSAPDLDGFDITAVAEMVYKPMQGND